MRLRKVDIRIERNILIGMITDSNYLAYISGKVNKNDLKNPYARTIAGWCFDYFEKYGKAPGHEIQEIYEYNTRKKKVNESEIDFIEKLLKDISIEYSQGETINIDFLLDKTQEYFKRTKIQDTLFDIQEKLDSGLVNEAENEMLNLKTISLVSENACDPLSDEKRIQKAFEVDSKPILCFKKGYGELVNDLMTRASFVCYQAPEKTGKTWLLYYNALMGVRNKLKVVLFQAGDMTEGQSIIRLGMLLCPSVMSPA